LITDAYRSERAVDGIAVDPGLNDLFGQLQLNAFEPLAGVCGLESQALLYRTSIALRTKCIDGITVNEKVLQRYMDTTVGIVTALNPVLGYEKATELAAEAYKPARASSRSSGKSMF
jgi:aspartate ammonia-lyase